MIEIKQTPEFLDWLDNLRSTVDRARIDARLVRVTNGNLGDHKPVGDGVSELAFRFRARIPYLLRAPWG